MILAGLVFVNTVSWGVSWRLAGVEWPQFISICFSHASNRLPHVRSQGDGRGPRVSKVS